MSKFTLLDTSIYRALFSSRHTCRYNELNIQGPAVVAFWHDELLPVVHKLKDNKTFALVSGKRAGKTLGILMRQMGHKVVHGSSSRDGVKAVRTLLKSLNDELIMVACDGPRGPRHQMKPGALYMAQKADIPLYLIRVEYKGWRIKNSWDKFLVPWPFAKVKFIVEEFNYKEYSDKDEALEAANNKLAKLKASKG